VRILRPVFVAAALALALGSCAPYLEPTYAPPASPLVLSLPTQSSAPASCPDTSLAPITINWNATFRRVSFGGEKLIWPAGFTARELPSGRLEIYAPDGTVVARDGDTITPGGADYQHVCRIDSVQY
jgi:hypothetical protein